MAVKKTKKGATEGRVNKKDAEDNKGMAILAYLLFIIPLLTGAHKTSKFVLYHTNQGIVLWIATLIFSIAYGILMAIFSAILLGLFAWRIWAVFSTILSLLWILPLILFIIGIVNAVQGKMKPLPIIGGFTILK